MIRLLQISAVVTLLALALMVWSMLQPTPLPVMLAMTVGQGLGTLAFGAYGYVVWRDLRRAMRAKRASLMPPFAITPRDPKGPLKEPAQYAKEAKDAQDAKDAAKDVVKDEPKDVAKDEPKDAPKDAPT